MASKCKLMHMGGAASYRMATGTPPIPKPFFGGSTLVLLLFMFVVFLILVVQLNSCSLQSR